MAKQAEGSRRSPIRPTSSRLRLALAAACSLLGLCACGGSQGSSTAAAVCQPAATSAGSIGLTVNVPGPVGVIEQPTAIEVPPPPLRLNVGSPGAAVAYTPAQIRAAYDLPGLLGSWGGLTAVQGSLYGAGQTVYIIDAYDLPNIAQDLTYFSQQYGLPVCKTVSIAPTAALPLAPADPTGGCTFSVVYASNSGTMTAAAPAYSGSWHAEHVEDVEAVHEIAPLARIVLIETPSANTSVLGSGVILADTMGPGIVSMSYSAKEFGGEDAEPLLNADDSYTASTGDGGAPFPPWPAGDPNVLACGGTSLLSYGNGSRVEKAWSGTGGGISSLIPEPSYQDVIGGLTMRSTADVSFDADPNTGPYMYAYPVGTDTPLLEVYGGTSLAAPAWAGILALADAERAAQAKGVVAHVQGMLYRLLNNPVAYAQVFNDITSGSDGTCGAACTAQVGYDQPTGLGTPNVSPLVSYLTQAPTTTPPFVSPLSVTGSAGAALSASMPYTAPDAVRWELGNAPAGMSIDSTTGLIGWASPTAGTYSVTVTATDTVSGLSDSAVLSVTIVTQATSPSVSAATVAATAGQPLSYQVQASAGTSGGTVPGAGAGGPAPTAGEAVQLQYAIQGAPSGMRIDASTGVLSWASPVPGTYPVTVSATNSNTGLSADAVITVQVNSAASGTGLTVQSLQGSAGTALTGVVATVSEAAAAQDQVTIRGAAVGMNFSANGGSVILTWPTPVCGAYTLTITATDAAGVSVQRQVTVTIATT